MAVTITAPQATVAVRAATDADQIDPAVTATIGFLFPAAALIVVEHAPTAPDAVHDAAVIRLLGWLYDSDPAEQTVPGRGLQLSGAASLLAQWRVHRAGAITAAGEPAPAPTPPVTPGNVPAPPGDGHYILTSNNGVLTWVLFPAPS